SRPRKNASKTTRNSNVEVKRRGKADVTNVWPDQLTDGIDPTPSYDEFNRVDILADGWVHISAGSEEIPNRDELQCRGSLDKVLKWYRWIVVYPTLKKLVDNMGYLAALTDYDILGASGFDWGTPIMATLYRELDEVSVLRPEKVKKSITKFYAVLEYWLFEYCRVEMYLVKFQMANDTVPLGYLAAVNDLDSAAQYDWGSVILASLYHGLDTAVTTGGAITRFVQLLTYWFYEYCGVDHPIVKEEVKYHIDHRTVETIAWEPWLDSAVSETEDVLNAKLLSRKRMSLQVPNGNYEYYLEDRCWRQLEGEARIPLDLPLSMSPHISPTTLHEMRQAGLLDYEQFVVGEERETYTSYWVEQTLKVGHILIDSQRMGNIDLFGLITFRASITPVMVTSTSVHSLSQDISLPESARDAQRFQEVEDELTIARRKIDSINHQLYAHDLQLRRGRDVRVVPLPPKGGARTRQCRSGPRTKEGGTSRRGKGTGDDYE
ncbi:hypothetical protein GIB67_042196, partial [Kingdonia uniflora]